MFSSLKNTPVCLSLLAQEEQESLIERDLQLCWERKMWCGSTQHKRTPSKHDRHPSHHHHHHHHHFHEECINIYRYIVESKRREKGDYQVCKWWRGKCVPDMVCVPWCHVYNRQTTWHEKKESLSPLTDYFSHPRQDRGRMKEEREDFRWCQVRRDWRKEPIVRL